ncbi:asparagine synthase-related protein [Nocardiopsis potens]|uniref:asparagine synthase-related protein n=1 Tax=Nocardiopsis potens TaxID=1246458 RepID=UPI00137860D2|nr:asparagine synthase-related protein [Nocardiopsis potens]
MIASVDGRIRVQGTLSTTRHVFYRRIGGAVIAADRPQALAWAGEAEVDEERLPLHLLAPFGPPWPLSEGTLWKGVDSVPPGSYLSLLRHGGARATRWWSPPSPDLPLREGGEQVRAALETAVRARTGGGEPVAVDLSGGMDSTSLAFLAAEHSSPVVTVHTEALGSANDDAQWAERCRRSLPDARHLIVRRGTAPALYSPLEEAGLDIEGPLSFARARSHYEDIARRVAGTGARYHLGGVGGDELFQPSVLNLTALLRSAPLRTLPHIRRFRHRYRWNLRRAARVLERKKSYQAWLSECAERLTGDRSWGASPDTDWEIAPRMPPWSTERAIRRVAELLREAAQDGAAPLDELPVNHEMLRLMQVNGRAMRMNSRIAEHFGVALEAPYCDDAVIQAAMSVRLEDRVAGEQPKPVLAEAMRGRVPHVFERRTKGDASTEIYTGIRLNRAGLDRFCRESRLAKLGLIDAEAMRDVVLGLHADTRPLMPFDATLGTELWLRGVEGPGGPTIRAGDGDEDGLVAE